MVVNLLSNDSAKKKKMLHIAKAKNGKNEQLSNLGFYFIVIQIRRLSEIFHNNEKIKNAHPFS